jgi:kynurenine formamidase
VPPADADDLGAARMRAADERVRNWGRWGPGDEVGTLNHITPDAVRRAARLVRKGRVFSLAIAYDDTGPQRGHLRRFNPMTFMLRDGDDAFSRGLDGLRRGDGFASEVLFLAAQGATHWDALGHAFYEARMWNGYDCTLVTSRGAERNDIAQYRDRIAGRAVLLDIPRSMGLPWCEIGQAVTVDDIERCVEVEGVAIARGDIVLFRFGHIASCRAQGDWGTYTGGDAPGLAFDTLEWIHDHELAGVASDTWGVEVRPNEFSFVNQPWHRIAIPQMGLLVGEMFDLEELAEDCADDATYEMFFVANPLPVKGSVGGPINPTAIK